MKIEQQEIKEVQSKESIVRKNLAILREENTTQTRSKKAKKESSIMIGDVS